MHKNGVMVRDLRDENALITPCKNVAVIDPLIFMDAESKTARFRAIAKQPARKLLR